MTAVLADLTFVIDCSYSSEGLHITLSSLEQAFPSGRVIVISPDSSLPQSAHPLQVHGRSDLRSAFDGIRSGYAFVLQRGDVLADPQELPALLARAVSDGSDVVFPSIRRIRHGKDGRLNFARTARENSWYRVRRFVGGRLVLDSVSMEVTNALGSVVVHLGGDSYVISASALSQLTPDKQFETRQVHRDLSLQAFRLAGVRSSGSPNLRLLRTGRPRDVRSTDRGKELGAFLRKWEIHTEVIDGEPRKYEQASQYEGVGTRVSTLEALWSAARASRADRSFAIRMAKAATEASYNRFIVSRNPDLLARNTFVARDGSWLYVQASKCGCTSVKSWLAEAEMGLPPELESSMDIHDVRVSGLLRGTEVGTARLAEMLRDESVFKFAFVRNPFARAVSAYYDKFVANPGSYPPAEAMRNRALQQERLEGRESDMTFVRFLESVLATSDSKRDRHWRTVTSAIAWGVVEFDFVGAVESMRDDLERLSSTLEARSPLFITPTQFRVMNRTGSSDVTDQYLTSTAVELIRRIYQSDFDAFGYSTNPQDLGQLRATV